MPSICAAFALIPKLDAGATSISGTPPRRQGLHRLQGNRPRAAPGLPQRPHAPGPQGTAGAGIPAHGSP